MNETLEKTNLVEVKGKIVSDIEYSHQIFGEVFYRFTLEVLRYGEAKDEIIVVISERLADISGLREKYVVIQGEYRSYNRHEEKSKLLLYVFAQEIEICDEEDVYPGSNNKIFLRAYICKPPVYRKTLLGREICDLLVAVNRPYGKSDYIPCITWGRNARFTGKLEVGEYIQLQGRIQSREYFKKFPDDSVEKRIAYEVSVSKLELIY